jgi:hypothetical protein
MVVMRGRRKMGELELDLLGCGEMQAACDQYDEKRELKASQAPEASGHGQVSSCESPGVYAGLLHDTN